MSFHIVHRSRRCLAVTLLKGRWLNMSRYRCNHQSCRPAEPRVSSLALKLEDVITFYQTNRNVTKREAQKNNRLWGSRTSSVSVRILVLKDLRIVNMSVFVMGSQVHSARTRWHFGFGSDSTGHVTRKILKENTDYTWNLFKVLKSKEIQ